MNAPASWLLAAIGFLLQMNTAFATGWITHGVPPRGCDYEVLNPHLGGDIFLSQCAVSVFHRNSERDAHWPVTALAQERAREPQDPLNTDQWALDALNVRAYWESHSQGDARIKVALIDTGVDYRHHDLRANLAVNQGEIPDDGLDNDENGFVDDFLGWDSYASTGDPMDLFDHGTHVAGIIGATTDNELGISGLNWRVSLIPIRFTSSSGGGTTAAAIRAFDYAVARGAKIINLSWGGRNDSPLLQEILRRCRDLGILIVAAAGNEETDNDLTPTFPASYPLDNILSVAALDFFKELAWFSNWGAASVHVAAPGQSILSTIGGNKYGYKDGTSMAVPQIVGAAALVWAAFPEWSYRQVRDFILGHCTPHPALQGKVLCGGAFSF